MADEMDRFRAYAEKVLRHDEAATASEFKPVFLFNVGCGCEPTTECGCGEEHEDAYWLEGPRFIDDGDNSFLTAADAALIAHYRTAAPVLARAVEVLLNTLDALHLDARIRKDALAEATCGKAKSDAANLLPEVPHA